MIHDFSLFLIFHLSSIRVSAKEVPNYEGERTFFFYKTPKVLEKKAQKVGGPGPPGLKGAAGHEEDFKRKRSVSLPTTLL